MLAAASLLAATFAFFFFALFAATPATAPMAGSRVVLVAGAAAEATADLLGVRGFGSRGGLGGTLARELVAVAPPVVSGFLVGVREVGSSKAVSKSASKRLLEGIAVCYDGWCCRGSVSELFLRSVPSCLRRSSKF